MSDAKDTFRTLLKENGYSLTRQRAVIFDILAGQEPMSMNDLIQKAVGLLDKVSVYRTTALFEKLGIVHRVNIGWKYKLELADRFAEHHHHLACKSCGRVIAINTSELETFMDKVAKQHEFQAAEHQIEIQGYCQDCRSES